MHMCMYLYMCIYTHRHTKKDLSKNIFIFKILALGLKEELLGPTNWLHRNNGCKSIVLRKCDLGRVVTCTGRNIHNSLCPAWHAHPGGWRGPS